MPAGSRDCSIRCERANGPWRLNNVLRSSRAARLAAAKKLLKSAANYCPTHFGDLGANDGIVASDYGRQLRQSLPDARFEPISEAGALSADRAARRGRRRY